MAEKLKTIAKNGVFWHKGPWTEPQKNTKSEKVNFPQKTMVLHLLVKFKQKRTKKSKKIAKNSI